MFVLHPAAEIPVKTNVFPPPPPTVIPRPDFPYPYPGGGVPFVPSFVVRNSVGDHHHHHHYHV